MSYYTDSTGLEYDESGYEALEHRVFQWRDRIMEKLGYPEEEARKLAWRYVQMEERKAGY